MHLDFHLDLFHLCLRSIAIPNVLQAVFLQIGFLRKTFPAHFALVRSLSGVEQVVRFQIGQRRKSFFADFTLVFLR